VGVFDHSTPPVDAGGYALTASGAPAAPAESLQAARAVTEHIPAERTLQSDQQRVQAYMLHHVHHTSLNNQASVVPFVKVAAFESR
jgi:hypothetical protein